jgi:hypothetical protein
LTLFTLGVFLVDDVHAAFATDDFAIGGAFFDRRFDFHDAGMLKRYGSSDSGCKVRKSFGDFQKNFRSFCSEGERGPTANTL